MEMAEGQYPVLTLSGKQREIQEREELFLELARRIFLQEGYHALTIGRIARLTGFSKGTVYQRFACKEELMMELAIRACEDMIALMQQVAGIRGRPRERIVAIGRAIELYAGRYFESLTIMAVIQEETIMDRVPAAQRQRKTDLELRFFDILIGIVRDAVDAGDLKMPTRCTAQSIALSLWALIDGWGHAVRGAVPLKHLGLGDAVVDVLRSAQFLMDGYGWRPLYRDWDYHRVEAEVDTLLSRHASVPHRTDTESKSTNHVPEFRKTAEGGR